MEENNEKKVYDKIGSTKLLDINVVLDGETIYTGLSDDAPDRIKGLWYSKAEMGNPMTFIAYSEFNKQYYE